MLVILHFPCSCNWCSTTQSMEVMKMQPQNKTASLPFQFFWRQDFIVVVVLVSICMCTLCLFFFCLFVCAPICLFVLFCYSVSWAEFVFTTQSKFPFCKLYIKSLLDHKKRVLGCLYVKVTPCQIRDDKFGKLALRTRHLVLHRHRPQRV